MKFLPEEHKSIVELLKRKGYSEEAFSFRKKKGLLHIEIQDRTDTFCFYRKRETKLNANLKFEDVTQYFVGPKKEPLSDQWEDVLAAIAKWLT